MIVCYLSAQAQCYQLKRLLCFMWCLIVHPLKVERKLWPIWTHYLCTCSHSYTHTHTKNTLCPAKQTDLISQVHLLLWRVRSQYKPVQSDDLIGQPACRYPHTVQFQASDNGLNPQRKVCSKNITVANLGKVKKVKCTFVQALRICTGRTAHRGSGGTAVLYRH